MHRRFFSTMYRWDCNIATSITGFTEFKQKETNEMLIEELLHAGLLVENTARSLGFYHGILGMEVVAERPDLGYPGAWLRVGRQQLHLLELPNPDATEERPSHGGRDRHVALAVSNIEVLQNALETAGIAYTKSKSGRKALFCRDPDNNALEFVELASPS